MKQTYTRRCSCFSEVLWKTTGRGMGKLMQSWNNSVLQWVADDILHHSQFSALRPAPLHSLCWQGLKPQILLWSKLCHQLNVSMNRLLLLQSLCPKMGTHTHTCRLPLLDHIKGGNHGPANNAGTWIPSPMDHVWRIFVFQCAWHYMGQPACAMPCCLCQSINRNDNTRASGQLGWGCAPWKVRMSTCWWKI